MIPATNLLGILLAFTSALVWGSGDFTGGLAARKMHHYQVLLLSAFSGLAALAVGALLTHESFPRGYDILWSALAGITGTIGITSLYKALSIGEASVVAPTSAVLGAGIPVAFNILFNGLPTVTILVGFLLAFVGIWIVSQSSSRKGGDSRKGFWLACLSGFGFAGFMILMAQVQPGKVFTPLIIERIVISLVAILLMASSRLPVPDLRVSRIGLLAGVLDIGGNVFFMLAKNLTRMDIAVVLSSLYPAATVILTGIFLKEKITLKQWVGVIFCLVAIILITL